MTFPKSLSLSTKRFLLRIPSREDFPHIFSATRFKGFNDGMLWEPPEKEADLLTPLLNSFNAWEEGTGFSFTVENNETNEFLGRISIRITDKSDDWNVGFWTHPEQQGKGIMTEALGAVLEFGFTDLKAKRIEACHALWNKASERVLQKNGMQFVRFIPQGFKKNGKWIEENLLAIDRIDWLKNK